MPQSLNGAAKGKYTRNLESSSESHSSDSSGSDGDSDTSSDSVVIDMIGNAAHSIAPVNFSQQSNATITVTSQQTGSIIKGISIQC